MDYPRTDRWQRPMILLPGEDEEQPFTRVTTIAKTLDGGEALVEWRCAMVAGGAALRPDIVAQVAANWPRTQDNKKLLAKLAESLQEAAAASTGRNLGDAAHAVVARFNRGERFTAIPPLDVTLKAYSDLLERAGITPRPDLVEQTCVLPDRGVAGSFDFIGEKGGQLLICDLKTGQYLEYSWLSIAIQLALYAGASTIYDWETRTHRPMPEVNQRQGLIIHIPAGTAEAKLHAVDLEAGRAAAECALAVRAWRGRKNLARPAKF